MNAIAHTLVRAYPAVLRLYPRPFREEYGAEMEAIFVETCQDAAASSALDVWLLGLRELRDLPVNLFREYSSAFRRKAMQNHPDAPQSLPKSILRGGLGFGIGFFLIFLIYCVLDTILNAGKQVGDPGTVFKYLLIHPNALGSALGAAYLAWGSDRRTVWLSALSGFLGYELIMLIGSHAFLPYLIRNEPVAALYQALFMAGVGILIGGGIGLAQRGWKQAGWSALAGAAGYNLGWLACAPVGLYVVRQSPFGFNLTRLVIGTPWYYAYYLAPAVVLGLVAGLFLGAAQIIHASAGKAAIA